MVDLYIIKSLDSCVVVERHYTTEYAYTSGNSRLYTSSRVKRGCLHSAESECAKCEKYLNYASRHLSQEIFLHTIIAQICQNLQGNCAVRGEF